MKVNLLFLAIFISRATKCSISKNQVSAEWSSKVKTQTLQTERERESISSLRKCVKIGSIEREMSNLGKIKKQPANRIDSLSNRAAARCEPCHRSRLFSDKIAEKPVSFEQGVHRGGGQKKRKTILQAKFCLFCV